jgi:ABC-type glycerol-3-phosphate transport system substrate-binding protein
MLPDNSRQQNIRNFRLLKAAWFLAIGLLIVSLVTSCASFQPTPTPVPVTVRFAYLGQEDDYAALAEEFHTKYPHITIELVSLLNENDGFRRIGESLQSADLVRLNSQMFGDVVENVIPLDPFMESDLDFSRAEFFPGSMEALRVQGAQLGIPAGLVPMVMYYESMRFTIAKLPEPSPVYDLDEFLAYASAINNQQASHDSGLFAVGYCTTPRGFDPVVFAYLFGGGLFDQLPNPTAPTLNLPANVRAVEWYASLFQTYQVAPQEITGEYQVYGLVNSASCGFWMSWMDMFGFARRLVTEPRILPLPRVQAPFSVAALDSYFITKASQHPQEAWLWLSFISRRQEASMGQLPPITSQLESVEFRDRVGENIAAVSGTLSKDTIFFGLDFMAGESAGEVYNLFTEAVTRVVEGEIDAQNALDEAQDQALQLFER